MNETIYLSDLEKDYKKAPEQKGVRDFYDPVDSFNSIRNNTTIEDAIAAQPDYLDNGTVASKIQLLSDKKNQYDLINNRLQNIDTDIASELGGRGITQIGRRAKELTKGRELDAQRQSVLSDMEYLRGNIQTAESLAKSAAARAGSKTSSDDVVVDYDFLNGGETTGGYDEKKRADLIQLISIMNPELGEAILDYDDTALANTAKKLGIKSTIANPLTKDTGLINSLGEVVTDEFLTQKPEEYQDYVLKYYKDNK